MNIPPWLTWPDDPLDLNSWFTDLDMSNWHMVVKPQSFIQAMASGVVWSILISRWGTWHDIAHTMLEDAELSVVCDRYLDGDDPPWEGANLRHGTLVIDIVDKSDILVGTSNGGTIFDGLVRTAVEFTDDFIDSSINVALDTTTPEDYFLPGNKYTNKLVPYVVYREGETSTIEKSEWINSPAKGIQVNVGGHSMPGVVCAPPGNWGGAGHTGTHQRTKLSQPRSKRLAIWGGRSSKSVPLEALWTPSLNRCTRTPSWPGGR